MLVLLMYHQEGAMFPVFCFTNFPRIIFCGNSDMEISLWKIGYQIDLEIIRHGKSKAFRSPISVRKEITVLHSNFELL